MTSYEAYNNILAELKKLGITYDILERNQFITWIPYRCSKAQANNDPLIYICYDNDGTLRIILGKTKRGCQELEADYKFQNEIDFHSIISKILNYYFEEIDKTP